MPRAFQCPNCRNWYTPVPVDPDLMCAVCADGKHTPNRQSGIIDCHWGQRSATWSEAEASKLLAATTLARNLAQRALDSLQPAAVTKALQVWGETLVAIEAMPRIQEWAGVFEMPGLGDAKPQKRFLSLEVMEKLVDQNRRPPEDVEMLRQSVRNCKEVLVEFSQVKAATEALIVRLRAATQDTETVSSSSVAAVQVETAEEKHRRSQRERMAKARAAKKQNPTATPEKVLEAVAS